MIAISLPRQSGKTNYLIIRSGLTGLTMVVIDRDMKKEVLERARNMGVDIPDPLTFREHKDKDYYGRNINGFLFDDFSKYKSFANPMYLEGPPIVEAMM